MAINLPAFANTAVDDIPTIVEEVRSTFFSQKTKPIDFRLRQLRKLYWG
jgi:beta-apo-4'-carotenal oxygenase